MGWMGDKGSIPALSWYLLVEHMIACPWDSHLVVTGYFAKETPTFVWHPVNMMQNSLHTQWAWELRKTTDFHRIVLTVGIRSRRFGSVIRFSATYKVALGKEISCLLQIFYMSQALHLTLIVSVAVGVHISLTSPTPTTPKNRRVIGDYPGILYVAVLILKVSNLESLWYFQGTTYRGQSAVAFCLCSSTLVGPMQQSNSSLFWCPNWFWSPPRQPSHSGWTITFHIFFFETTKTGCPSFCHLWEPSEDSQSCWEV